MTTTFTNFFISLLFLFTIGYMPQVFGKELLTKGTLVCEYSGEPAVDETEMYCSSEKQQMFSTSQKELKQMGWHLAYEHIDEPVATGCPQCEKWKKPGFSLDMYNSCIKLCKPNSKACNQVYRYEKE